jgi:hypothetical protein
VFATLAQNMLVDHGSLTSDLTRAFQTSKMVTNPPEYLFRGEESDELIKVNHSNGEKIKKRYLDGNDKCKKSRI